MAEQSVGANHLNRPTESTPMGVSRFLVTQGGQRCSSCWLCNWAKKIRAKMIVGPCCWLCLLSCWLLPAKGCPMTFGPLGLLACPRYVAARQQLIEVPQARIVKKDERRQLPAKPCFRVLIRVSRVPSSPKRTYYLFQSSSRGHPGIEPGTSRRTSTQE